MAAVAEMAAADAWTTTTGNNRVILGLTGQAAPVPLVRRSEMPSG
jgi:hypothetical protein